MPDKSYLNPDTMGSPQGYSHVVKVGDTVYIAGQVARARDGSGPGVDDPEGQVRQVWRNVEAAVKSVGGNLQNIVKTTTYITSIQYSGAVRKVRDELYKDSNPPTSTLLVISELAAPEFLVEIEAIAVV